MHECDRAESWKEYRFLVMSLSHQCTALCPLKPVDFLLSEIRNSIIVAATPELLGFSPESILSDMEHPFFLGGIPLLP